MTTITIGHPDSIIHEATAAAIIRVLEANDIEPEIVIGPKSALGEMLQAGEVDLYVSAWLPGEDTSLLGAGVTPLGALFNPSVSCSVSQEDSPLASLADLAQAPASLSRTLIIQKSLEPQAKAMLAAYNLEQAGFTLNTMSDEQALAAIATALGNKENILMLLTQPCYLFHQGGFKILNDPQKVLSQEMTARMLLRPGLADELDQDVKDELDELMLSAKVISAMDFAIRTEGLSADDAAESWQRGKLLPR